MAGHLDGILARAEGTLAPAEGVLAPAEGTLAPAEGTLASPAAPGDSPLPTVAGRRVLASLARIAELVLAQRRALGLA